MGSQNNQVPFPALVELARKARALDDPYVQRALLALAVTNDPGLANALLLKLNLRAVVEMLNPFPFDIPSSEEEFL